MLVPVVFLELPVILFALYPGLVSLSQLARLTQGSSRHAAAPSGLPPEARPVARGSGATCPGLGADHGDDGRVGDARLGRGHVPDGDIITGFLNEIRFE